MKKILALILALVMCLSTVALLASCNNDQGGTDNGGTVTYNVAAAKDYVKSLYTKYLTNNKTNGNFKLVNQVKQGDVTYTVTWTSDNEAVKVVETEGETSVTIQVPEKPAADVNYTLKATITAPDGTTATWEMKLVVPMFDAGAGFDDYIAAVKGDAVVVEGIVTSISSKSQGSKYNALYLQDLNGKGGYYIYSIKDNVDPVADLALELGMTVSVSGTKDIYNSVHEVKDAVVTVTDKTVKPIEFIDITEKALAAKNAEDLLIANYQGCYVTIKGVVIGGTYAEQYYHYWSIGNVDSYTRLAASCGLDADVLTTMKNEHIAHKGYTATVKGIVNVYNGVFYLVPVGEDAFVYGEKLEVTDAQKVADEKGDLTVKDKFTTESTLTLPLVGTNYEDVVIAWTSSDTSVITVAADGKVTFVAAGTATLTATLTAGDATETKTFTVTVESTGFNPVKPVVGTAYKLAMFQEMAGKIVYMNGEVSGYYLATTENFASGIDFYIEETKDGFYVYTTINGAKKYLNMVVSGEHVNAVYEDAASTVFTYNETIKTIVGIVNDTEYVFGTRNDNTYTTVGANKLSYNPFMVVFVTEEGGSVVTPPSGDGDDNQEPEGNLIWTQVKPVVGKGYKFGLYQGNNKKYIYLNGQMVNTYYFGSTTTYEDGIDVYIEETTGGYYLYYMKGETKTYINIVASGSYTNAKYETTASSVWTWNETKKMLTTKVGSTEYTLGTYNTYDSVSPSKVSSTSNFFGGFVEFIETEADPEGDISLSLTEATELALNRMTGEYSENKYVVTGMIVSIQSATYGNLTIKDEAGNTFIIYGTYYPYYNSDNSTRWDKIPADQRPGVGDTVSFYGVLGNYNGTAQMKNASILDGWTDHVCEDNLTKATCEEPAKCKLCGTEYGVTYVHVVEDCECTVCGTAVHIFRDGECIDCGELDSVKNVTISFSSTANRTQYTTDIQVWEQNGIKVTNNKAASTSNVGNYSNPARFYASSQIIIEAKGISVIKFTCNSSSYATALKNSLGTSLGTVSVSGSVVTLTLTTKSNSVNIAKLTAQVRINSITINP